MVPPASDHVLRLRFIATVSAFSVSMYFVVCGTRFVLNQISLRNFVQDAVKQSKLEKIMKFFYK